MSRPYPSLLGAWRVWGVSLIGRFASLFGQKFSLIAAPGIRCNALPDLGISASSSRCGEKFPGNRENQGMGGPARRNAIDDAEHPNRAIVRSSMFCGGRPG
jgi:hypothetical protein